MGLQSVPACTHSSEALLLSSDLCTQQQGQDLCTQPAWSKALRTQLQAFHKTPKLIPMLLYHYSFIILPIPSLTYIYRVSLRSPLFTNTLYIYCGLIPWAQNYKNGFPLQNPCSAGQSSAPLTSAHLLHFVEDRFAAWSSHLQKRCFQKLGPRAQQAPNTHLWLIPSHFGWLSTFLLHQASFSWNPRIFVSARPLPVLSVRHFPAWLQRRPLWPVLLVVR